MKLELQRKIDRVAGTFICRIFSFCSMWKKDRRAGIRPQNVLIILLSEMGSIVLARPMFDYVKAKYPEASVYVLLFEQNKEILEAIEAVPPENIITVRDISLMTMLSDSLRVLKKFRKARIDVVIDCELFSRISSIYSFMSGAKIRVGFHPHTQEGLYRGDFINRPVLYNPYHHISNQFITLSEAIESEDVPKVKRDVNSDRLKLNPIKIEQDEIKDLLERFRKDFPIIAVEKLILLYVGGGLLPIRAWPLENFCIVARDLIKNGYTVGVIGLKEDRSLANDILADCSHKNCIDLTGYTKSIRELMIIFHFASLLITNDGGPGHFAAMTPVPSIILYGPETPLLYGPLGSNSFNFYVPLSCSPCVTAYNHRNSPCDGDNRCLKNILPKDVLKKTYEILEDEGNLYN